MLGPRARPPLLPDPAPSRTPPANGFGSVGGGLEPAAPCRLAVLDGERITALAENLRNSPWSLGGIPCEHRIDSLPAAHRVLGLEAAEDAARR